MYKVERKPANQKAQWYEVMLSPFSSKKEAENYIETHKVYYPLDDRNYRITVLNVS